MYLCIYVYAGVWTGVQPELSSVPCAGDVMIHGGTALGCVVEPGSFCRSALYARALTVKPSSPVPKCGIPENELHDFWMPLCDHTNLPALSSPRAFCEKVLRTWSKSIKPGI